MNPTKEFVEMVYRTKQTQMNDGTGLAYLSSFGIWMGSIVEDREKLMSELIPITEEEAQKYIK